MCENGRCCAQFSTTIDETYCALSSDVVFFTCYKRLSLTENSTYKHTANFSFTSFATLDIFLLLLFFYLAFDWLVNSFDFKWYRKPIKPYLFLVRENSRRMNGDWDISQFHMSLQTLSLCLSLSLSPLLSATRHIQFSASNVISNIYMVATGTEKRHR